MNFLLWLLERRFDRLDRKVDKLLARDDQKLNDLARQLHDARLRLTRAITRNAPKK